MSCAQRCRTVPMTNHVRPDRSGAGGTCANNATSGRVALCVAAPGADSPSLVNWPEITVEPIERLTDHVDPRRNVTGMLEHDVPLVLGRRAQQLEQRPLRRVDWKHEIVSSSEQQHRRLYRA